MADTKLQKKTPERQGIPQKNFQKNTYFSDPGVNACSYIKKNKVKSRANDETDSHSDLE